LVFFSTAFADKQIKKNKVINIFFIFLNPTPKLTLSLCKYKG
jgi:hypothetical protein